MISTGFRTALEECRIMALPVERLRSYLRAHMHRCHSQRVKANQAHHRQVTALQSGEPYVTTWHITHEGRDE